jgi:hypothetical protein
MDPLQRSAVIERYRSVRCDVLEGGSWRSVDDLPAEPMFLMTAWNPGNVAASEVENQRNDARLHARLLALGLRATRIRGRAAEGVEPGWMFPHERRRSMGLLAEFGQVAGVIWEPRGRSLLWAEGLVSPIDGDRCEIPDEDPA